MCVGELVRGRVGKLSPPLPALKMNETKKTTPGDRNERGGQDKMKLTFNEIR